LSRVAFDAKRLGAILVVGAVLFIAAAAYVISRQRLPSTYVETAPKPTATASPAVSADGPLR
jgi:hypothetical protein